MAEPRQLRTLEQAAAERPWTSVRYLRRLRAERRLAFHVVGGRLLVDLADLDELAERGRQEPPRPATVLASRRPARRPEPPGAA